MVLALRIWQPSVVITDLPDEKVTGYPLDRLVVEAVRTAAERAADPKVFPEMIDTLGLEPCRVVKVYGLCDDAKKAQVKLDLTEVVPALQGSVQEVADKAAFLFDPRCMALGLRSFRHLVGIEGSADHTQLMQGVDLTPGGEARRSVVDHAVSPDELRVIRSRLNLRAMADHPSELVKPEQLLTQIGPMLADMPDEQAGRAAHAAAMQYVRIGQWSLAREAFLLMIDRYPAHPLSVEAYRWLMRHNCSSEVRRRYELGQFYVRSTQSYGQLKELPKDKTKLPIVEMVQEQEGGTLVTNGGNKQWYQACVDLESKLAVLGPQFVRDPAAQFCIQSARRNMGDLDTPRRCFTYLAENLPEGPWRRNALVELWLLDRKGPAPKETIQCGLVDSRPRLDGKLDDACWKNAQVIKLVDAGGKTTEEYPTDVRMTHDQEFLYVAVPLFSSRRPGQAGPETASA